MADPLVPPTEEPRKRKHGKYSREDIAELAGLTPQSCRTLMHREGALVRDFTTSVLFIARRLVRQGYVDDEVRSRASLLEQHRKKREEEEKRPGW